MPCGSSLVLNHCEQCGHADCERSGQFLNVHETQVTRAPFHVAQVSAVDACLVRQIFLCQSQLLTTKLHGRSEPLANIGLGLPLPHCRDSSRVHTISDIDDE